MKGDKRRIKKIVTGLVILVLLGITLSGVRIRSVGQYKQEQKQLANDLFATPDKDADRQRHCIRDGATGRGRCI